MLITHPLVRRLLLIVAGIALGFTVSILLGFGLGVLTLNTLGSSVGVNASLAGSTCGVYVTTAGPGSPTLGTFCGDH